MTQHLLQEQNDEDQATMRRLAKIVGGFVIFTALLAVGVGLVMS